MVLVETATRLHLRLIELDKLLMSCCQEQFTEEQRGFCISEIEGVARDIREIVDVLVDIKIKRERPDEFPAAERPTEKAGMLSLDHIRSVYTGIELLWQCSLKHFVEMHLPFYTEMDLLHPKALVLTKEAMTRISSIGTDMSDKDRWGIHTTITDVAFLYTFCNTMNKRFVRRVIAFQLLTSRLNPEFEVQGSELLDRSLHGLIDEECFRNYVVAVKSLIHMAGSTQCVWLMQMCGRLLGEFISTHRGLKFVLQGYLDGTFSDRDSTVIQEKVAKSVTSVPSRLSKVDYFKSLCSQLLQLLLTGYEEKDNMLLQVCSNICNRVAAVSPILFQKAILVPILNPLLAVQEKNLSQAATGPDRSNVISDEAAVTRAVALLHQVLSLSPVTTPLLMATQQAGAVVPLLSLYTFILSDAAASGLSAIVSSICDIFITRDPAIPGVLNDIKYTMLNDSVGQFYLGSNGGVEIRRRLPRGTSPSLVDEVVLLKGGLKSRVETMRSNTASQLTNEAFEEIMSLCMEQQHQVGGVVGDSPNVARALAVAHTLNAVIEAKTGGSKHNENESHPGAAVISSLFLDALSGYMAISLPAQNPSADADSSVLRVESREAPGRGDNSERQEWGVLLLALQSALPMSFLLADGVKIIRVLRVVLESHCNTLDRGSAHETMEPTEVYDEPSARPLIVEIPGENSGHGSPCIDSETKGRNFIHSETKDNDENEFVSSALSILSTMLAFGASSRSKEEETALRNLLPCLQRISSVDMNAVNAESATDVAVAIMTRGLPQKTPLTSAIPIKVSPVVELDGSKISETELISFCKSTYNELLVDDQPAMRALGVRNINATLKQRLGGIQADELELIVGILVSLLEDSDSFVYLSVVHTIKTLIDGNRRQVISMFLALFENNDAWGRFRMRDLALRNDVSQRSNLIRRRILLGESLMFGIRRAGENVSQYASDVIYTCLRVIRAENARKAPASIQVERWNMHKMTINNLDQTGETAAVSESKKSESESVLTGIDAEADAVSVDAILLRQSALSLIAEVVAVAGYGSSRYLVEVAQLAVDVLSVEHSTNKASVAMRRSAAFMIEHIITGLQHKLFYMKDSGSFLKTMHAQIKLSFHDKDLIVRVHASKALYALNTCTRQQLFFDEDGGPDPDVIPPLRILR